MKTQVNIKVSIPADNNWHRVTRKIEQRFKKKSGKKNRSYTFSMFVKSKEASIYGIQLEQR